MLSLFATALAAGIPLAFSNDADVISRINTVANWIFAILMVVAVIFILLGAFSYLTAGGGEASSKAHKKLLYAAIAVAVAVLSKGLVAVIAKIVSGDKTYNPFG